MKQAVCTQPDAKLFCELIAVAASDDKVAQLYNNLTVVTVFVPTDRGINNTRKLILRYMGATLASLVANPVLASRFVRSHMVLGFASRFSTFRNNQIFFNALTPQQPLYVVESKSRQAPPGVAVQKYIRMPINKLTRAGFQDRWDRIGGAGLFHVVEDPIIPSPLY
eukprot:CAMPEP_0202902726 /NCGR_PEP_ID=MMETSP1392-20130828/17018_1 /ASSEMBLY_ACC=CAM_ASM_000868 /TAXON_ID=225041 /ORGANISM="Chlamydomonas chlamydogama, Strain SAG 11-48b" /LENGTH=165 /DNA_ID=CAMNT_0049589533 /DNA_START=227 /DNA_END=724 /DNA_ORIENTATION=+